MQKSIFEELSHQHEVLFVVKVIMQAQEAFFISVAIGLDISKDFYRIQGQIELLLIVFDKLAKYFC
jgi:hypothetical protein